MRFTDMGSANIPAHIGIIMDGNGRWAHLRDKDRSFGHRAGTANVERIVEYAFHRGVKALTLYAFSSENWARPEKEIDALMRLLERYIKKFAGKMTENGIRLKVIGDIGVLSEKLKKAIYDAENATEKNTAGILNIGINYGARQEIVRAVKEIISQGKEISVESISEHLYTFGSGEPDLIIRTGGELRLSNFMLFQGAYSELYFTDVLWPDFDEKEFDKAIESFSKRQRRYGAIK